MSVNIRASEAVGASVSVPLGRSCLATLRAYVALTKPRIIAELLITTVPAMVLAAKGWPGWGLLAATIVGGYLAAGGAGAINCYIDRDVDRLMARTRGRPVVTGAVAPRGALAFGIVLGALAFAELALAVNLVSALLLAVGALVFYVFVYTLWLKRSTPQNIVIGGAAGAMPPLIGWAAVTGGLSWAPAVMFLIVFLWTPPHFWALALRYKDDYARAHIPMLPVVRGQAETLRQIRLYTVVLIGCSLLLLPSHTVGVVYTVAAVVLGSGFIALVWRLGRRPGPRAAMGLFKYSITYLSVLFVSMAADQLAQHFFGRVW